MGCVGAVSGSLSRGPELSVVQRGEIDRTVSEQTFTSQLPVDGITRLQE